MVSQILWLSQPTQNSILTANSKEIRLFKIKQKQLKRVDQATRNFKRGFGLVIPKFSSIGEPVCSAKHQHSFKICAESNIHSLSLNID